MIYALFGDIRIGDAVWTGPVSASETRKAALVLHKVSRGKMPVQDHGDDNDHKELGFFFDETFCEPQAELGKLQAAFAGREALPLVSGDGAFDGVRWLIEDMSVETLKTTPAGRPVRIKVKLKLVEAPNPSPRDVFAAIALASAVGLSPLASLSVEVQVDVQVDLGPISVSAGVGVSL
jgi:phage protein U